LRASWGAVYSADLHAHVFLSWAWLRGWFEVTPFKWFVLAARLDRLSPYVAFFPLAQHRIRRRRRVSLRELHMGGNGQADYTGFLCLPECEEEAIPAFACYLQRQMKWDRFHMKDVLDPRLDLFLRSVSLQMFHIQPAGSTVCPFVDLPCSWEEYLQSFLGPRRRKELRRCLRRVEGSASMRFAHTGDADRDRHIEALLGLWQSRWGPRPERDLDMFGVVLRRCFAENCLFLPVLWDGGVRVAAVAAFVDRQQMALSAYLVGHEPGYAKMSPGTTIFAYAIRYAIENGFKRFDFLRGDETYKHWFGTKHRSVEHVLITQRDSPLRRTRLVQKLRRRLQGSWSPC
jgi:CelD/BcsL family acetyltransferase involved in cellulose biosynthesis